MKNLNVIKIGFDSSNDISLKDDSISALHAYLKMIDESHFELQDAGSSNGIHVNNRRIKNKVIDEKDQIIFGGLKIDTPEILEKAKGIILNRRTDFSIEYSSIINQLKVYSQQRDKLSDGNKWGNIARVGGSVILILILVFKPELIPDPTIRYILIMAVGLIPVLLGMFTEKGEKKRTKLELLKLKYENDIKCPKCKIPLLKHTPQYLIQRKKCPNEKCNARFFVE